VILARIPPLGRALLALLLVLGLGAVFDGRGTFYEPATHLATLRAAGVIGVLSVGMTLVILTGGIDLSVGSMLGLCGMLFAALSLDAGLAWPLAVLATLALGLLGGAVNGVLVGRLGLQPFIATLATMAAARGAAKYLPVFFAPAGDPMPDRLAGTKVMPPPELLDGTPFMQALAANFLGLPVVGLVFLATAGLAAVVLHHTVYGRHVYAIGGSEGAAHLAGIPVERAKVLTYALSGALAGLGAVLHVALARIGDPEAGAMFELEAIAAVVIGGTVLTGGRGGVLLSVVGVLTIGYIEKVLSINGVREHWRLMIQGAIIVVAVLLQRRR